MVTTRSNTTTARFHQQSNPSTRKNTTDTTNDTTGIASIAGSELWEIIRNGKTFLAALEAFAKLNYPNNKSNDNTTGGVNIGGDDDESQADGRKMTTNPTPTAYEHGHNQVTTANSKQKRKKRRIVQICANTGKEIGRFDSVRVASNRLAVSFPTLKPSKIRLGIENALKGSIDNYLYFKFRYDHDVTMETPIPTSVGNNNKVMKRKNDQRVAAVTEPEAKRQKPNDWRIIQYNITSGLIEATYDTLPEAAEALVAVTQSIEPERARWNIDQNLRGWLTSYQGHLYRYANSTSPMPSFPITNELPISKPNHPMVLAYCSRTGNLLGRFKSPEAAVHSLEQVLPHLQSGPKLYQKAVYKMITKRSLSTSYRGIHFRYSDDESPMPTFPIPGSENQLNIKKDSTKSHVNVYCSKTGMLLGKFKSVLRAKKYLAQLVPTDFPKLESKVIYSIMKAKTGSVSHKGFYFRKAQDPSPMPLFPLPLSQVEKDLVEIRLEKMKENNEVGKIPEIDETGEDDDDDEE